LTINRRPPGSLWETPPFDDEIFRIYVFKIIGNKQKTIEHSHPLMTVPDGLISLIFISSFPPTRIAGAV
jgi:hypothetical protein